MISVKNHGTRCLLLLSILTLPLPASLAQETGENSDRIVLDKFNAMWDFQRTALRSGTFQTRGYKRLLRESKLTRDQVRDLVSRLSQGTSNELLLEIGHTVDPPRLGHLDIPWEETSYWFAEDGSYKFEERLPGERDRVYIQSVSEGFDVRTFPVTDNRSQVTISREGMLGGRRVQLSRMVYFPRRDLLKDDWRITEDHPTKLVISRVGSPIRAGTYVIDKESGFVHEYLGGVYSTEGKYFEILQFNPMLFEGGIILPHIKLESRYENGHLRTFDLQVIEKANPNQFVPDTELKIAVQEADTVIDQTTRTAKPIRNTREVDDATIFLSLLDSRPDNQRSNYNVGPLITTLFIVFLFIAILVKHLRRRASSNL